MSLLGRRFRNELRCEDLPIRRVLLTPALAHERHQGIGLIDIRLPATLAPAARVTAIQHEVRDAFGMAHSIGDRHGAALGNTQERKPVEPRRVDDRLEVAHERIQGDVIDIPIGKTIATLVVTDQPASRRQRSKKVAPDGALPIVFEMIEPICRLHQRHTLADGGMGDTHPIRRSTELYFLAHPRGGSLGLLRRSLRNGSFVVRDSTNEAKPFAGDGLDQNLVGTAVPDSAPGSIDTACECRLRDDPTLPDRFEQIILGYHTVPVLDQKHQ